MDKETFFSPAQMTRLKTLGAVPHFYTAVNLSYKNNTSAKMDTEVADIYEKASGQSVSRNFACGHCSYELYLKAGNLYYRTLEAKGEPVDKKGKGKKGDAETQEDKR